jgi:hypothetical protein
MTDILKMYVVNYKIIEVIADLLKDSRMESNASLLCSSYADQITSTDNKEDIPNGYDILFAAYNNLRDDIRAIFTKLDYMIEDYDDDIAEYVLAPELKNNYMMIIKTLLNQIYESGCKKPLKCESWYMDYNSKQIISDKIINIPEITNILIKNAYKYLVKV